MNHYLLSQQELNEIIATAQSRALQLYFASRTKQNIYKIEDDEVITKQLKQYAIDIDQLSVKE
jgi:hypothetical protein